MRRTLTKEILNSAERIISGTSTTGGGNTRGVFAPVDRGLHLEYEVTSGGSSRRLRSIRISTPSRKRKFKLANIIGIDRGSTIEIRSIHPGRYNDARARASAKERAGNSARLSMSHTHSSTLRRKL